MSHSCVYRLLSADGRLQVGETDPWQQSWQVRTHYYITMFHLSHVSGTFCVMKCPLSQLTVLCVCVFRGRDPSEAGAHRQKGGGCYSVGRTNTLR